MSGRRAETPEPSILLDELQSEAYVRVTTWIRSAWSELVDLRKTKSEIANVRRELEAFRYRTRQELAVRSIDALIAALRTELADAQKKAFEGWAHAGQVQKERDALGAELDNVKRERDDWAAAAIDAEKRIKRLRDEEGML